MPDRTTFHVHPERSTPGELEAMITRYYPGRMPGRDYDPMPSVHVQATVLVAMNIEDATAKVRRGGLKGPRDADPLASGTAGVLELPRLELPFQALGGH